MRLEFQNALKKTAEAATKIPSALKLFRMAVYNWWTRLVDWTTGLIDFHLKHTEMLQNVAQSTTVVDQHASSLADRLFISVTTFTLLCSGVHKVYSAAGEQKCRGGGLMHD